MATDPKTIPKQPAAEKAKPFQLVKYFTFSGLIILFAGAIALSILNINWVRQMQLRRSEDFAALLIKNLNHQIFIQFFIPITLRFGKIQLREQEQFEVMDKVVRSALHGFDVESVTIYDNLTNVVSYSYDPELVGKKGIGGSGYQVALSGRTTSRLLRRGNLVETLFGYPKEIKIVTFSPLRLEKASPELTGPMIGIISLTQDLTEQYKKIFDFQILVIVTITVFMGTIFISLLFVVKRGEGIIEKRAQERIQLKEQLSRAEHLSTLGEMVAGVSHEIRNPLGIIKSSAELLQKKMTALDKTNTIPQIIVEEARRLDSIIADFLNYARPKSPNFTLCHVEAILEKNIAFLQPQLNQQGYEINRKYSGHLPEIQADKDMLYQAFLNILINGMQAMPQGGTLTVETSLVTSGIRIVFTDHGPGIAPELLKKIWDPFFTTKDKGTGLGLGIVKNIIEAHGGEIRIANSALDDGTGVTIELPARRGA